MARKPVEVEPEFRTKKRPSPPIAQTLLVIADGAKGRFKTASGGGIANSWIPNP
jgi:hypothetical protein